MTGVNCSLGDIGRVYTRRDSSRSDFVPISRALPSGEEPLPGVRLGLSMLVRVHVLFKNRAAVGVDRKRSRVDHVVHHVSRVVCIMQPVRVVVLQGAGKVLVNLDNTVNTQLTNGFFFFFFFSGARGGRTKFQTRLKLYLFSKNVVLASKPNGLLTCRDACCRPGFVTTVPSCMMM